MGGRGVGTFFARTPKRRVLIDSSSCFWLGLMHVTTQVRALPPRDSAARVRGGEEWLGREEGSEHACGVGI